jgi:hypothetical protein
MTLSPKTLTSIAPLALSTRRVRISLIAFERAFMSIAHIPRTIVGFGVSLPKYKSEACEPVGEGVEDLASMELERGEYLSVVCNKETRDGLSQCIVVLSYWQRRREPGVGQAASLSDSSPELSVLSAAILLLVSMRGWGTPKEGVSGGLPRTIASSPPDE